MDTILRCNKSKTKWVTFSGTPCSFAIWKNIFFNFVRSPHYQFKPTKPNLPNLTYQTKPTNTKLPQQTYQTKPTKPNQTNKTFQSDKNTAPKSNS